MELQKSFLRTLATTEVVVFLACGVSPQPSATHIQENKNHKLVETSEYGVHRWGLLSPTGGWKAVEDNTTFDWVGQYCRGNFTPNQQELSATCVGYLIKIRGKGQANKGEVLDCAKLELPLMTCILFDINPPLDTIYTVFPNNDISTTPSPNP